MFKRKRNTPEVAQEVAEKILQLYSQSAQHRASKVEQTQDILELLSEKDWETLSLVIRKKPELFIDHEFLLEEDKTRFDVVKSAIIQAVRNSYPSEDMNRFISDYFSRIELTGEELEVIYNPRLVRVGVVPEIRDHWLRYMDIEEIVSTIKNISAESVGPINDLIIKLVKAGLDPNEEMRIKENAEKLFGCFDHILKTQSDIVMFDFLKLVTSVTEVKLELNQDQFRELISKGMNASVGYAMHKRLYTPDVDDLFFSLEYLMAESESKIRSRNGRSEFATSKDAAGQIIQRIQNLDTEEFDELLTYFESNPNKSSVIKSLLVESLRRIPLVDADSEDFQNRFARRIVDSKVGGLISAAINKRALEIDDDLIDKLIKSTNSGPLMTISSRQNIFSESQMDELLKKRAYNDMESVIQRQLEVGYVPQSERQLHALVDFHPEYISTLASSIASYFNSKTASSSRTL